MALVLDASVTTCRAFADKSDPIADVAFSSLQTEEVVVPALWSFEIRNILVVGERRGRIAPRDTGFFLRALAQFPIRLDRHLKKPTCWRWRERTIFLFMTSHIWNWRIGRN